MEKNADKISYYVNVIPDKYPQINIEQIKDTTLYNYIGIGGNISDDYGLSDFKFYYRKKSEKNSSPFKTVDIPFNKTSLSQTFFYQINIETIGLNKSDALEYYLQISDNDGVNGRKSSKTNLMNFEMPTAQEFDKEINKQVKKVGIFCKIMCRAFLCAYFRLNVRFSIGQNYGIRFFACFRKC